MIDADGLYDAVRARLGRRPLVLLLDVDGTLSPIAPTPESAAVPEATRRTITRLVGAPGVHVALVSGRAAADARRMVGVEGVWAIGNHGFERISPDGVAVSDAVLEPWRQRIASAAAQVEPFLADFPGTLLEDKGWTLSIHYRGAPAGVEGPLRKALEAVAEACGLRLTAGRMVFELRPPVHVDKGTASLGLLEELLIGGDGAALYAGDDRTDEDAFEALRSSGLPVVTIRVQGKRSEAPSDTAAEFLLADVGSMRAFLQRLADDASAAQAS